MKDFCLSVAEQFRWLEKRFRVRINIHDTAGFAKLPGAEGLSPFSEHHNPLCYLLKRKTETRIACLTNKYRAHRHACQKDYHWGRCLFGFTELVVPILIGEQALGSIYVGQFYTNRTQINSLLAKRALQFDLDVDELRQLFFEQVQPLPENLEELATPTMLVANALSLYYQTETMGKWLNYNPDDYTGFIKDHQEEFLVSKTIEYVKEHYSQDLSLLELANHVSCSPSYLSRLFKKRTGISLNNFINQTRIVAAKALLQQTELPVSTVAIETGFTDPNYFSRQFRLFVGKSPTEFRQGK